MIGLEVRKTQHRGLGVFATQLFEKGDLIECCRVLVVLRNEILLSLTNSVLRHHVFAWGERLAVPTGYGPFYNHSYKPNALHVKHLDISQIHYHAIQDIQPGEEITINYGGYPDCTEPVWFDVKDS